MPILSLILWIPAAAALAIALLPDWQTVWIRGVAQGAAAVALMLAWSLNLAFDSNTFALQFREAQSWNPEMGSFYALGVDGFSFPMVLLTTLLTLVAVLASAKLKDRLRGYHVCLLILESGMLGVFMAQDWVLFYVFWEMTLVPLFFLLDQWGHAQRHTASLNFALYTLGGSVFMLVALLMVYAASGEHSTEMEEMVKAAGSLPADQQALVLIGLLLGFGAMLPMFPLHGWLPLAQKQAPSPVAILIVGVLLNMGAYGLLRSVEMLPLGAAMLQPWLAGLAVIGVVHGALQACRQTDLRAMVAYLSISQMGVVLLGISSLKQTGFLGAALQMSAHGWVAGGVCLLVGLLALRIQSSEMVEYGSLAQTAPRFAVLMALTLFAAMALPGTLGFIAFFHALLGGWERWGWWTLGLCLGVLLSAVCALRVIVLLFMGGPRSRQVAFADLQGTELVAAVFLGFAVLLLGVVPSPVLHWAQASAEHLGEAVQTYDAAES